MMEKLRHTSLHRYLTQEEHARTLWTMLCEEINTQFKNSIEPDCKGKFECYKVICCNAKLPKKECLVKKYSGVIKQETLYYELHVN